MIVFSKNHYILLLQNLFTGKITCHDVYNKSCDSRWYVFEDFEFSGDNPPGEYEYVLLWDILDYSIESKETLLNSIITVNTIDGEDKSFEIKDLNPEIGLLQYVGQKDEPLELNISKEVTHLWELKR